MSSFFEDFDPLFHFSNKITGLYESVMLTASCGSDGSDDCRDDKTALHLKMIAITTILISGIVGVSLPLLFRKRRFFEAEGGGSGLLSVLKAFAAGVILATGFVHMLHDANKALSAPCLPASPWRHFPFSGFIAMLSALATLVVDFLVTQFYEHKHKEKTQLLKSSCGAAAEAAAAEAAAAEAIPFNADERGISVHSVGSQIGGCVDDDRMHIIGIRAHVGSHCVNTSIVPEANDDASIYASIHSQARHVVVSQILELGIVSHSVIIGLSLGVSRSPCTIRPLVAALSFHQFFEGFALGGCISQAQFKNFSAVMMASFFAITTPFGIGIGAGISSFYNPNSPGALIVEGILDSISAGILIYMSLVDLIAADFQSRTMRANGRLLFASYLALFLGAGAMSSLAIWA